MGNPSENVIHSVPRTINERIDGFFRERVAFSGQLDFRDNVMSKLKRFNSHWIAVARASGLLSVALWFNGLQDHGPLVSLPVAGFCPTIGSN